MRKILNMKTVQNLCRSAQRTLEKAIQIQLESRRAIRHYCMLIGIEQDGREITEKKIDMITDSTLRFRDGQRHFASKKKIEFVQRLQKKIIRKTSPQRHAHDDK